MLRRNSARMAVCALTLVFLGVAFAQSPTGTITGTVSDATGAVIPGALVEATNVATSTVSKTQTTATGSYTFTSMPAGDYAVSITAQGFKTARTTGIEVRTAQISTQNVVLQIGQLADTVTVSAETPLINPDSAAVTTTVQNKLLSDLPVVDRSMLAAVLLAPGAQGDPQYNQGIQSELPGIFTQSVTPGASISFGGGRPGSGSILVDGSDVTSAGYSRAIMTFSADQVQEVSVQSNGIPAQYGRTMSAIINQTTKSGANDMHGSVLWTHIDPFFETKALGSAFPPTQHYNAFDGAIGGPVIIPKLYNGENRTFFWATGEPQRQTLLFGASRTRLPTADELAGNFYNSYDFFDTKLRQQSIDDAIASATRTNSLYYHYPLNSGGFPNGTVLPSAQWKAIPGNNLSATLAKSPLAQRLLSTLYPYKAGVDIAYIHWLRPDGLPDIDGNNAIYARGVSTVDNRWSFKIDQYLGSADRMSFRYSIAPVTGTRFDWGGPNDPANPLPQDKIISRNFAYSWTHSFSAHLIDEFRASYSRGNSLRGPSDAALSQDWGSALGLVPDIAGQGFPKILGRGLDADGSNNGTSIDENIGFGNDLSYTVGRHTFRFGGEFRDIRLSRLTFGGMGGGAYNFSSQVTPPSGSVNGTLAEIGGIITGSLNTYTFKQQQTNDYYRWHYGGLYIQDDFKMTSRLTLNVGLRWDVETPRTEKYDRQGSFDPFLPGQVNGQTVTGAFVFSGHNGIQRNLWPINWMGFQPRLGLAYSIRPSIVWRTSYSILRAPITGGGLDISPDLNLNTNRISSSSETGGVSAGPVNLVTNPIGPLPPPAALSYDPIFFMNNANTFAFNYIPQNSAMPYAQKWSTDFQFQLGHDFSAQIGYEGMKGTHLFASTYPFNGVDPVVSGALAGSGANFSTSSVDYNPLKIANSDGSIVKTTLISSLRPYSQFFSSNIPSAYDRSGNSIYNGLNATVQKRFSAGLTFLGSYSWSKSIDDGSSNLQTTNITDIFGLVFAQSRDRSAERSLSTFDIPHKFRAASSYELPFGKGKALFGNTPGVVSKLISDYTVSGMTTWQSGYPLVVYIGSPGWYNSTGGGSGLDTYTLRPDRVPGVPVVNPDWRSNPFVTSYINPAAFTIPGSPANPMLGNTSATLPDGRSPRLFSFDASLAKNIKFGEGKRYVQLRADAFNVLNHPVFFANPNGRNGGIFSFDSKARTFTEKTTSTVIDPNNTAQFGNYSGRSFRLSARFVF